MCYEVVNGGSSVSDIKIELLKDADYEEVIEFELNNRDFLRQTVPGRDDDRFYHPKNLRAFFEKQLAEIESGECFSYLIRNGSGELVGRCHLYDIKRGPWQKAKVGCHLSRLHVGQGVGTTALRFLVREAFEKHGLHQVEASTISTNIAAQIAVLRCGFQYIGKSESYVLLNGKWTDAVHFAIVNPKEKASS
jgi:ribosomal-protein-alanine N-acetyltransferase